MSAASVLTCLYSCLNSLLLFRLNQLQILVILSLAFEDVEDTLGHIALHSTVVIWPLVQVV